MEGRDCGSGGPPHPGHRVCTRGGRQHTALATSGSAERGEHIWRLGGGAGFVQVTVAAADIVTADVLATAIVSGGTPTLNLATDNWDVAVLAIRADGSMLATPAFQYA